MLSVNTAATASSATTRPGRRRSAPPGRTAGAAPALARCLSSAPDGSFTLPRRPISSASTRSRIVPSTQPERQRPGHGHHRGGRRRRRPVGRDRRSACMPGRRCRSRSPAAIRTATCSPSIVRVASASGTLSIVDSAHEHRAHSRRRRPAHARSRHADPVGLLLYTPAGSSPVPAPFSGPDSFRFVASDSPPVSSGVGGATVPSPCTRCEAADALTATR